MGIKETEARLQQLKDELVITTQMRQEMQEHVRGLQAKADAAKSEEEHVLAEVRAEAANPKPKKSFFLGGGRPAVRSGNGIDPFDVTTAVTATIQTRADADAAEKELAPQIRDLIAKESEIKTEIAEYEISLKESHLQEAIARYAEALKPLVPLAEAVRVKAAAAGVKLNDASILIRPKDYHLGERFNPTI